MDAGAATAIVETDIPARLDRLPWGRFHNLVIVALGITWALDGLEVHPERMRRSLELTGGMLMAESVTTAMAGQVGLGEAKRIVEAACRRAVDSGKPLRDELVGDDVVSEVLGADGVERALDPLGYLGSAEAFVDRALDRYGEDRP